MVPQLKSLVAAARSNSFGGLVFLLLGIAGYIVGPWTRNRVYMQTSLMLMVAGGTVSLFSVQFFQFRYAYFLLPFLFIGSAQALWRSSAYVTRIAARMRVLSRRQRAGARIASSAGVVLSVGLAAIVVGLATKASLSAPYDDWGSTRDGALSTKQAGLWLASQSPHDKVVMDAGAAIPFYADADYIALPYASESVALRYIDSKAPDYVVVRGILSDERPYLGAWAEDGIPGYSDRLVYDSGGPEDERIQIYRWNTGLDAGSGSAPR